MEKKILDYLLEQESPFTWNIPDINDMGDNEYIDWQIEKLKNMDEENNFKWTKIVLNLLLAYELTDKRQDYEGALGHTAWCNNHLLSLHFQGCQEQLFRSLYSTLVHVIHTTEAFIHFKSGDVEKANKVVKRPLSTVTRPSSDSANILGTRAALYIQYGTVGHRLALKTARQATDRDPDTAEWWFLIANSLGRIRRTEKTREISTEESAAIEKAFALDKNATYTVHLAQIYKDKTTYWFCNGNPTRAKQYEIKAAERYREAIAIRPNCLLLKSRVAHGMMRIRDREARNISFVKQLLDEVVEETPGNSTVHHDLGYYYETFEKNTEKALMHLRRSNELGNIRALLYMICLKWKCGKEDEIIGDLKEGLTRYKSTEAQAELLANLGVCHALINDDWEATVDCLQSSLMTDPSANYFRKFYGFDRRCVNLLELVMNHLHQRMTRGQDNNAKINEFLEFVRTSLPDITSRPTSNNFNYHQFIEWKEDQLKLLKRNRTRQFYNSKNLVK